MNVVIQLLLIFATCCVFFVILGLIAEKVGKIPTMVRIEKDAEVPERHAPADGFRRLGSDLKDMEYELSTAAPAYLPPDIPDGHFARADLLAETEAERITGMPTWQLRRILTLRPCDVETAADFHRWQRHYDTICAHLTRSARILDERRDRLALEFDAQAAADADHIPSWMRIQA